MFLPSFHSVRSILLPRLIYRHNPLISQRESGLQLSKPSPLNFPFFPLLLLQLQPLYRPCSPLRSLSSPIALHYLVEILYPPIIISLLPSKSSPSLSRLFLRFELHRGRNRRLVRSKKSTCRDEGQ